jgi:stage III sporulation protein AH
LIKAKGFTDCVVFLQNSECSVVVKTKDSNPNNAVVIKDIVAGQAGVSYDKIKIIENK